VATVTRTRSGGRFNLPLIPTIVAGVLVVAVIATIFAGPRLFGGADPLAGREAVPVSIADVIDEVAANGRIEPRTSAALTFAGPGGRVSDVLVAPGDTVLQGDALIQLELRRLQAAVAIAEADLARAQADLAQLREGASEEEIAVAQAQIDAARGALVQVEGSVTAVDLRAGEARVAQAQALLTRLEAGARAVDQQAADAQLAQAEAALIGQRDALSAAKTTAELGLQRATTDLTSAQAAYAEAKSNWDYVQETGNDPITPTRLEGTRRVPNAATPGQREQYQATFIRAEAALRDAEVAVQQKVVALDTARQAEASGVREAEARVGVAQANAAGVAAGADADAIAAARAQLAGAQADLERLRGVARSGALDAQRANLAAAEARLAQLTADPASSALARADAAVARAAGQLELARADLDDAVLRAPFAGVIGSVDIAPGEVIGQQSPITLLDLSTYVVKLNVGEIDVARVVLGQPVIIALDALGGAPLDGRVVRITPLSAEVGNVTSYEVTVEVDPAAQPVKPGMTASATIVIGRADGAVTVPAAAIRQADGATVVDVVTTGADGRRSVEERPVTVGINTGVVAEVRTGLRDGETVLLP